MSKSSANLDSQTNKYSEQYPLETMEITSIADSLATDSQYKDSIFKNFSADAHKEELLIKAESKGINLNAIYKGYPIVDVKFNDDNNHIKSLKNMQPWTNIPRFSVITGFNGAGKTHLLDYIVYNYLSDKTKIEPIYRRSEDQIRYNRSPGSSTEDSKEEKDRVITEVKEFLVTYCSDSEVKKSKDELTNKIFQEIIDSNSKEALKLIAEGKNDEIISNSFDKYKQYYVKDKHNPHNSLSKVAKIFDQFVLYRNQLNDEYNTFEKVETMFEFYCKQENISKYDNNARKTFMEKISLKESRNLLIEAKVKEIQGEEPWVKFNKFLDKNNFPYEVKYDETNAGSGSQETIKLIGRNSKTEINPNHISSGENLIIDILSRQYDVQYLDSGERKLDIIILDEPDRHFDPKICKIFLSSLKDLSEKNNIQVIMTTHRIDTIALADEGDVFMLENKDGHSPQIKPINKLLALIKLSKNIQTFTGMHTKIYTESFEDTEYYEAIYANLLKYSRIIRDDKSLNFTKANGLTARLGDLSHRYKMGFYSASYEKGESGGHSAVREVVRKENNRVLPGTIYSKNNNHIHFSDINSHLYNIFRSYQIDGPFGIIDMDYSNGQAPDISSKVENKIVKIKRHSLENFMFDPMILCSLFRDKSEIDREINNEDFRNGFKNLYDHLNAAHIKVDDVQNCLEELYKIIIKLCNENDAIECFKQTKFKKEIRKYIKSKKSDISKEDLIKETTEILANIPNKFIKQTWQEAEKGINQKNHSKSNLTKDQKKNYEIGDDKLFGILKRPFKDNKNYKPISDELSKVYESIKNIVEINFSNMRTTKIKYLRIDPTENEENKYQILEIFYPKDLKYIRGHNFEFAMLKLFNGNFKKWIIDRISEIALSHDHNILIPQDFIETIFELNDKVKTQIISKIDDKSKIGDEGIPKRKKYDSYLLRKLVEFDEKWTDYINERREKEYSLKEIDK